MVGSEDACFLCGASRWQVRCRIGAYEVRECQGCGLCRTHPIPDKSAYLDINRSLYTAERRILTYDSRRAELRKRYTRQLDQIERLHGAPGKTLLDVGCSIGVFASAAKARGYQVRGVELAEETARYAQATFGLDVFCGTLEEAHYPDQSFDVVTLWDVLEHVGNPIGLLCETRRILKDGGLLVVQCPNVRSKMASIGGERWIWWTVPDHLTHFDPNTMTRLLRRCGFAVASMETWEPPQDSLLNLLTAATRVGSEDKGRVAWVLRHVVYHTSKLAWPCMIPFQRRVRWQQTGGLLVAHGKKSPAWTEGEDQEAPGAR